MGRGKLPRSFRISDSDPLYSTSLKTDAYLYDAALAVLALAKEKPSLAYEIVMGIRDSQYPSYAFPEVANHVDATPTNLRVQTATQALIAYALGYYLEMYPTTSDTCTIVNLLRTTLHYLEVRREFVNFDGLIVDGDDASGNAVNTVFAETNILAYFAFKQAGLITGTSYYTLTANELKGAIYNRLWDGTQVYYSLDPSPVTDIYLDTLIWSYFFFLDAYPTQPHASATLSSLQYYQCQDSTNGAVGYKESLAGNNKVWFEMSYAVGICYFKSNDKVTQKTILNNLNQYVDATDGGVLGSYIKEGHDSSMLYYKGVGSTAWKFLANNYSGLVFSFRDNVTATSCGTVYFNSQMSQDFTKSDCASGYTPSQVTYTVREGRFLVPDAYNVDFSEDAVNEIDTQGQAYANTHGTCAGQVGNDEQSQVFYSSVCPSNTTAQPYIYMVSANTYFADTKENANALALNDISTNGQNEADANGACQLNSLTITLNVVTYTLPNGANDDVYVEVHADSPVTGNISVALAGQDLSTGYTSLMPPVDLSTGDTSSPSTFVASVASGNTVDISIISVSPNPDAAGTHYTW